MTSTEYFDNTKKHIEEMIRYDVKAESVKPESVYMDRALKHFKLLFTKQPGRRGSFVWKPHELKALNDIWTEIMPDMEKAISGAIHRYMK